MTDRGRGPSNRIIGWTARLQVQLASAPTIDRISRSDRGATAMEYALMASLIAVAIIAAVLTLSGKVTGLFQTVSSAL